MPLRGGVPGLGTGSSTKGQQAKGVRNGKTCLIPQHQNAAARESLNRSCGLSFDSIPRNITWYTGLKKSFGSRQCRQETEGAGL